MKMMIVITNIINIIIIVTMIVTILITTMIVTKSIMLTTITLMITIITIIINQIVMKENKNKYYLHFTVSIIASAIGTPFIHGFHKEAKNTENNFYRK